MLLGPGDPERSTRAIGVVSVRGTRAPVPVAHQFHGSPAMLTRI